MEFFVFSLLNGLSYGLLLFLLSAGLTVILSLMGVLNFAHASFYMLGAYVGYSVSVHAGYGLALIAAPVVLAVLGAGFERWVLRRIHAYGHVPELLMTFGLSFLTLELVQGLWGRTALPFHPPEWLQGAAFSAVHSAANGLQWFWGKPAQALCQDASMAMTCWSFPAMRAFTMGVSVTTLGALYLLLVRTRLGWIIQASRTHPAMLESLGHNVPRLWMLVFAAGSGLAGLAGVIGGSTFVTEPAMAATVGSVIFVVVVVGGLGSLMGAFWVSLALGLLQTLAVSFDLPLGSGVRMAQLAPVLPYALMVLVLVLRPQGLFGAKDQ